MLPATEPRSGSSFEIPTEAAVPIVETYEHYPPINAHVFALRAPRV